MMTLVAARGAWRLNGLVVMLFGMALVAGCARATPRARPAFSRGPIAFRLVLQEARHLQGQPVLVRFQLVSRAPRPILVNRRMFVNPPEAPPDQREVTIAVRGPDDRPLPSRPPQPVGLPRVEDFVELAPGQTLESERVWDLAQMYPIDRPGTYQIQATYRNARGAELGLTVFSEAVEAPPVAVQIDAIP
jgi:hypothetical protein